MSKDPWEELSNISQSIKDKSRRKALIEWLRWGITTAIAVAALVLSLFKCKN